MRIILNRTNSLPDPPRAAEARLPGGQPQRRPAAPAWPRSTGPPLRDAEIMPVGNARPHSGRADACIGLE